MSVDPRKLGLAGHGMGAGAAVLAASVTAHDTRVQAVGEPYWESGSDLAVRAVATIALSESRPSAQDAARAVHVPGMHLAFGKDLVAPPAAGAQPVAAAWAGPSTTADAEEGHPPRHRRGEALERPRPRRQGRARRTAATVKALLTGFLLHHLAGEKRYADVVDGSVKGTDVRVYRESSTV